MILLIVDVKESLKIRIKVPFLEGSQSIVHQLVKSFTMKCQDIPKFLIQKFQNFRFVSTKTRPLIRKVNFTDFLFFDKVFNFFGYSFLSQPPKNVLRRRRILGFSLILIIIEMTLSCVSFFNAVLAKEYETVAENCLCIGLLLMASLKAVYLLLYRKNGIQKVLAVLLGNFPKTGLESEVYKVPESLSVMRRLRIVLIALHCLSMSLLFAMPALSKLYGYLTSIDTELYPINALSLGFDTKQPIPYCVLAVLAINVGIFGSSVLLMTDLLFCEIVWLIALELNILAQKIREIKPKAADSVEKLRKVHNVHMELIRVSEIFQHIFSPLLLINVMAFISSLCATAFVTLVILINILNVK